MWWRVPIRLIGVLALVVSVPAIARADIIYQQDGSWRGTGHGAVVTVLVLHQPDAGAESGCVAWDGSARVIGSSVCGAYYGGAGLGGGHEQNASNAPSILDSRATSAEDLAIVFDPAESNAITLEKLYLKIFNPSGAVVFTASLASPVSFPDPGSGVGDSGFAFRLDTEQAALAKDFWFPGYRLGLGAAVSGAEAGPDSLYVGSATELGLPPIEPPEPPSEIPEPASFLTLGSALILLGAVLRRRRST